MIVQTVDHSKSISSNFEKAYLSSNNRLLSEGKEIYLELTNTRTTIEGYHFKPMKHLEVPYLNPNRPVAEKDFEKVLQTLNNHPTIKDNNLFVKRETFESYDLIRLYQYISKN